MKRFWMLMFAGLITAGNVSQAEEANQPKHEQSGEKLPAWAEFHDLLGKSIDTKVVQDFVARYQLKKHAKGDSGSFSNYYEMPFSPLFREDKIVRVVVRISNYEGHSRPIYTSKLPLGIQHEDKPDDVIRRLGNPESRSNDEWLLYKKLGLWLSFNRKTGKLSEINLDDPMRWKE